MHQKCVRPVRKLHLDSCAAWVAIFSLRCLSPRRKWHGEGVGSQNEMEQNYFPLLSLFPVLENKNVPFSVWCGVVLRKASGSCFARLAEKEKSHTGSCATGCQGMRLTVPLVATVLRGEVREGGAPRVARIGAVRAKFRRVWARGEHNTNAMGTHEI